MRPWKVRLLTAEEVHMIRDHVSYDPITGIFTHAISKPKGRIVAGEVMHSYVRPSGYVQIKVCGRLYMAHRVAWLLTHNIWPEFELDHEDHDRANSILLNLRPVTQAENAKNRSLNANSTSGITGVTFCNHWKKWRATINIDGKRKTLGYFPTKDEAAIARKSANDNAGYHRNHGEPRLLGATHV